MSGSIPYLSHHNNQIGDISCKITVSEDWPERDSATPGWHQIEADGQDTHCRLAIGLSEVSVCEGNAVRHIGQRVFDGCAQYLKELS